MSQVRESVDILNGLIVEIQTAIIVIKNHEKDPEFRSNELFRNGLYRICLQSIMLNLSKFIEFNEKYNIFLNSITPEHNELRKSLVSILLKKRIREFRNKYLAHVSCKKSKKALSYSEIDAYIEKVVGGRDAIPFFEWLSPEAPRDSEEGSSFLGGVVLIRNSILKHL